MNEFSGKITAQVTGKQKVPLKEVSKGSGWKGQCCVG